MTPEPPIEVELKYRVASAATGERLVDGDLLGSFAADGPGRTSESEDRYVDTADGAFAIAGYAARLRQTGTTTIVSVKSLGLGGGSLQRRTEIEGPADGVLAPAAWPPSPACSFVRSLIGDAPLMEVVTVRQTRRKRLFREGETTVELSLDDVVVIAGGQPVGAFMELEAELVRGPEGPLLALRSMLDATAGLSASGLSKFDAALAAAGLSRPAPAAEGERSQALLEALHAAGESKRMRRAKKRAGRAAAVKAADEAADVHVDATGAREAAVPADATTVGDDTSAENPADAPADAPVGPAEAAEAADADLVAPLIVGRTPGVTGDDVVAEAGRKVLRFHLVRLIAREPGTRLGEDPEELHGMRVATRRMRAAWRVFGDGFAPEGTKRFRNRLRDVAAKLGAVRDIDVLVIALETYRAALPADSAAALQPLVDDWLAQRDAGRLVLTRELDSAGHRRFVDDYRTFVSTTGAGAIAVSPTRPHHVRDTAGSRIWLAYETVLAYGPVLRWADVPTLHELRIAGKWLRYTLEFVAEALGPEAKPLIARVVVMQDHLGLMNDADVAAMKARALLVARSGTLTDAQTTGIARYLTSQEREVARLKRGATAPWRALASPTFRRGLGRAVATLTASPSSAEAR